MWLAFAFRSSRSLSPAFAEHGATVCSQQRRQADLAGPMRMACERPTGSRLAGCSAMSLAASAAADILRCAAYSQTTFGVSRLRCVCHSLLFACVASNERTSFASDACCSFPPGFNGDIGNAMVLIPPGYANPQKSPLQHFVWNSVHSFFSGCWSLRPLLAQASKPSPPEGSSVARRPLLGARTTCVPMRETS